MCTTCGAQKGIRIPTPIKEADFKSPKAHSPPGNVHLVNSFISDRRLRGLTPRTLQFYEGYISRFVNTLVNTSNSQQDNLVVPREGFEPTLPYREADFKSAASTIPPPGHDRNIP